MADVAGAIQEAVDAMEAADAAAAPNPADDGAPIIEDEEPENDGPMEGEPVAEGTLVTAAQAAQAAPAAPADLVLPTGLGRNSPMLQKMAEQVVASLQGRYQVELLGLMMTQDEIQHQCLALHQAPPIFRMRYDTQKNFSWAMFGFNATCMSYYEGGLKTFQNVDNICASA